MLKENGNFVESAVAISGSLPDRRFNALNLPRFEQKIPGDHLPKVAPGRFIVKFADSLAEPADLIHEEQRSFAAATPAKGDDLDRLHKKHGIRSVKPLFSQLLGLPQGGSAKKESSAERKRRFADQLSRIKAKYQRRTARASKDSVIPDLSSVYVFETPNSADIPSICSEYAANPNVVYAVPVRIASVQTTPNDPYLLSSGSWGNPFDDLWGLKKINAQTAWNSSSGQGVIVAVVDTGLDYNHPDIIDNVWANTAETNGTPGMDDDNNGFDDDVRGWNFVDNNNDPRDGFGHGTHVAGTIAAVGNNGIGVAGVAYQSRIMPVKGLDDNGNGFLDKLASAIVYAATNGADVISNSWGGGGEADPLVEEAVRTANSLGSVVVFAAGNNSSPADYFYPASIQDVVTVGSTGVDDSLSWFSNWGHMIDVVAPGGGGPEIPSIPNSTYNILSLRASGTGNPDYVVGDAYVRLAGTSMATPHVSGVVALLLAANPSLTRDQVISIIRHSADDLVGPPDLDTLGFDLLFGWGRLNAARALSMASAPPPDPPVMRIPASRLDFDLPHSQCGEERFEKLDIYNIGQDALNWTSTVPSWLSVVPPGGTAHAVPSVTVNTATNQQGLASFTCPEALDGRKDIPVTATVYPEVRVEQCSLVISQAGGDQQWAPKWNANVPGVPDGQGGAFYVFQDVQNVTVQRLDSWGNPLWGNGKRLTAMTVFVSLAFRPAIVSDGAGGAIIVWVEGENNMAAQHHIRGQRVSPDGTFLWGSEGIWINQTAGGQLDPRIIADGSGGAIVAWEDYRSGISNVYTQRVSATGQLMWQGDGVPVATADYGRERPSLAADGAGGAIIAWVMETTNVRAQHIDAAGIPLWGEGLPLNPATALGPSVVPDGAGGAIIAWYDFRNFPFQAGINFFDRAEIYAVRLNGAGQNLWTAGGIPLLSGLTANPGKRDPNWGPNEVNMVADGAGGAVVVWHDSRNADWLDPYWDIYAQRVNGNGQKLWTASGVPVSDARWSQISPGVVADGSGGAFFTYVDGRSGDWDVFMQHLNAAGNRQWGPGGLWIQRAGGDQLYPYLVPLGGNRLALSWDDWRNYIDGVMTGTGVDFFGKIIQLCSDGDGNGYYDEGGSCGLTGPDVQLSVILAGTGQGTVASAPSGIQCGADCTSQFPHGTSVTLSATSAPYSAFTGWEGACTGTGICTVRMDEDKQVTASFEKRSLALNYRKLWTGVGTVTFTPGTSCTGDCSQYYDSGTEVTLAAAPDNSSLFKGWGGACSGTGSCTVTMNSEQEVTASFLPKRMVAAGRAHTLAVVGDDVWGWGDNNFGQVGDGTTTRRNRPVKLPGLSGTAAIAAGTIHSLALNVGGTVLAWGYNSTGQLGDGSTAQRNSPVELPDLQVIAISGGGTRSMAIGSDGTVRAWGSGPLGNGTTVQRTSPVPLPGFPGASAIVSGTYHRVALKSDGTVWSWGGSSWGQIGDGTKTDRLSPTKVPELSGIIAVAAGETHTAALKGDGTVWTWGDNSYGQLGDGGTTQHSSPVQVTGLSDVVAIAAGSGHTLALKKDGTVWGWGYNFWGQVGNGTTENRSTPGQVSGLTGVVGIAAGASHNVVIKGDGTVWAWGQNYAGQLGDGSTTDRLAPVLIPDFAPLLPDTIISSQPANPTYSSAAKFTFSSPDSTASFECLLDSGGWTACSSGITYNGLAAGSHTFSVRAKNPAGNVDPTPATYSWNVTWPTSCNAKINLAGCYVTISETYNACNSGDIIQFKWGDFGETLDVNRSIEVTIQGGYDDNLVWRTTSASSIGGITITSGTAIVDSVTIK